MGCSGNKRLPEEKEKNKEPLITEFNSKTDEIIKENDINKNKKNELQNALNRQITIEENKKDKKIELSPQEIRKIKEDNKNMSDEIKSLKARISDLEKAINKLELENKQYKTGYDKLLAENNELKFNKNHQTNNQLKSSYLNLIMEWNSQQ